MYSSEQRLIIYQKFLKFYQDTMFQISLRDFLELNYPEINLKRDLPELSSKLKWYKFYTNDSREDILRECISEIKNLPTQPIPVNTNRNMNSNRPNPVRRKSPADQTSQQKN